MKIGKTRYMSIPGGTKRQRKKGIRVTVFTLRMD